MLSFKSLFVVMMMEIFKDYDPTQETLEEFPVDSETAKLLNEQVLAFMDAAAAADPDAACTELADTSILDELNEEKQKLLLTYFFQYMARVITKCASYCPECKEYHAHTPAAPATITELPVQGLNPPKNTTAEILAKYLGVPVDSLVKVNSYDEVMAELQKKFPKADTMILTVDGIDELQPKPNTGLFGKN